jgi:hypothetical protein
MVDVDRARLVERDDVHVMFKRVADDQTAIRRGWESLEDALGELRGRKFYGAFDDAGTYRVCVQLREGDDPNEMGLEQGTLPGGRYALVRLEGDPPAVYERIAPTFERLARRQDRDSAREGIEFYRRHDVIDLLLPVRQP